MYTHSVCFHGEIKKNNFMVLLPRAMTTHIQIQSSNSIFSRNIGLTGLGCLSLHQNILDTQSIKI